MSLQDSFKEFCRQKKFEINSQQKEIIYLLEKFLTHKETFLSSGTNLKGCYKLDQNMCSVDCCGKQWPVSFDMKKDPRIKEGELGSKYLPTNMSCTGKMGTGCICASNQQYQFLTDRGTNAPACKDEGSGYKLLQK